MFCGLEKYKGQAITCSSSNNNTTFIDYNSGFTELSTVTYNMGTSKYGSYDAYAYKSGSGAIVKFSNTGTEYLYFRDADNNLVKKIKCVITA